MGRGRRGAGAGSQGKGRGAGGDVSGAEAAEEITSTVRAPITRFRLRAGRHKVGMLSCFWLPSFLFVCLHSICRVLRGGLLMGLRTFLSGLSCM